MSGSDDSSLAASTSLPQGTQSFSSFGDGSCGEPLVAQHLVIDFTPVETVDNEYVQKKCCAFWDFINSQPELRTLMALPESNVYHENSETSDTSPTMEQMEISEPVSPELTAVSMLQIVEDKGLIDRTFEAKLQQSHCSLGSREYHENETTHALEKKPGLSTVCSCSGICKECSSWSPRDAVTTSTPDAVDLCKKMQEWDSAHPKCMEPPGHPPVLSKCVMQRKVVS